MGSPAQKRRITKIAFSNRTLTGKTLYLEPQKWLQEIDFSLSVLFGGPERDRTRTKEHIKSVVEELDYQSILFSETHSFIYPPGGRCEALVCPFLLRRALSAGRTGLPVLFEIAPSDRGIGGKACLCGVLRGVDVAQVRHGGGAHRAGQTRQVKRAEFVPFGQEDDRIRAFGRRIGIVIPRARRAAALSPSRWPCGSTTRTSAPLPTSAGTMVRRGPRACRRYWV